MTTKSGRMAPVNVGNAILACFGAGTGVLTGFGPPTHLRPNSDPSPTHPKTFFFSRPTSGNSMLPQNRLSLHPDTSLTNSDRTSEPNFAQDPFFFTRPPRGRDSHIARLCLSPQVLPSTPTFYKSQRHQMEFSQTVATQLVFLIPWCRLCQSPQIHQVITLWLGKGLLLWKIALHRATRLCPALPNHPF